MDWVEWEELGLELELDVEEDRGTIEDETVLVEVSGPWGGG